MQLALICQDFAPILHVEPVLNSSGQGKKRSGGILFWVVVYMSNAMPMGGQQINGPSTTTTNSWWASRGQPSNSKLSGVTFPEIRT
jgi:hypothetical protein